MIVIVPHRDLELKLINAQKKIIRQIFDYDKKIIPYAAMPLWIPTEFETLDEAKNAITKVTVLAPEFDGKGCFVCPVQIETTGGNVLESRLDFIRHCERSVAIQAYDETFPLDVKIFRLGECTSPKPDVYELSSPVWKKLSS